MRFSYILTGLNLLGWGLISLPGLFMLVEFDSIDKNIRFARILYYAAIPLTGLALTVAILGVALSFRGIRWILRTELILTLLLPYYLFFYTGGM
jgi:hypothetical protein